ncbi:MAG: winged helix-turn-helix domain-containing protein [Candidatus Heimdallarchaeota archaeon]|nr:winged helix-turn-helix domain-containing protein [Candidatus Heimdallarchaeota archaeon]
MCIVKQTKDKNQSTNDKETDPDQISAMINIIKAYQNKVQSSIIFILKIYPELSTNELSKKLNKSKPTILRNIQKLIELGIISVKEIHNLPGAYPQRVYSLNKPNFVVRGQDLSEKLMENPSLVLEYNAYWLNQFNQLRYIADAAIEFIKQREKAILKNYKNPQELFMILSDHLGSFSSYYLSRNQAKDALKSGIQKIPHKNYNHENNDLNEFMYLELFLPIKSLLDVMIESNYQFNGEIWKNVVEHNKS